MHTQAFGDNVDTDAILPGEYLHLNDMEELGKVCFEHTNPDFRSKVADGYTIGKCGIWCTVNANRFSVSMFVHAGRRRSKH